MKYMKWANLNDEGMKHWGDIFPDGMIPIQMPFAQDGQIEETQQKIEVYLVDWKALTEQEKDAVLTKLSQKFGAPKEDIAKEIQKIGLPLQSKYVSSCGIDQRLLL